jgi:hypothetical protein
MPDPRIRRNVTPTGRARGEGRVFRSQHLVRTRARGQERPMSPDIMCHPMRQTPTALHPQCFADNSWGGHYARMIRGWTCASFIRRKGLVRSPQPYALYVQGNEVHGYTDDLQFGLAWARAAIKFGYKDAWLEDRSDGLYALYNDFVIEKPLWSNVHE